MQYQYQYLGKTQVSVFFQEIKFTSFDKKLLSIFVYAMPYSHFDNTSLLDTDLKHFIINQFGCHIDAAEQQRAVNFELVVSD